MREPLVTVSQFLQVTEAHKAKGILESAGITCFIINENFGTIEPHIQRLGGTIELQVFEPELKDAATILQHAGMDTATAERCPACFSSDIIAGNPGQKPTLWNQLKSVIISSLPMHVKQEFYCNTCQQTYKR